MTILAQGSIDSTSDWHTDRQIVPVIGTQTDHYSQLFTLLPIGTPASRYSFLVPK